MGIRNWFTKAAHPHSARAPRQPVSLHLEALESRVVPYAVSGNLWPHPNLVTISFMPDGTNLGGVSSNLMSTFNAKFGSTAAWENVILKAAQQWAQQTNVNLAVVSDNGADSGSGNYQQGDPGFGDIRIGGFNFGDNTTLAVASMPPPVNNYSVAGDIDFNTNMPFNIGADYDLFTVAMHEFGHALGLNHTTDSTAVMYPYYNGVMSGVKSDDIAGIRAIYSNGAGRTPDAYEGLLGNNTFLTASNLNALIDPVALTAQATNLDITTTSDADYYVFNVPTGTTGTMTVNVQSSGLSLLAPSLKVYNGNQHQVANVSGYGKYGTTLTATVNGVSAGQTYYVKVTGADGTAMGTGQYALTLNFGSNPSPAVPLPNTTTPNGNPLTGGGGIALGIGDSGNLSTGPSAAATASLIGVGTTSLLPPAVVDTLTVAPGYQPHLPPGQGAWHPDAFSEQDGASRSFVAFDHQAGAPGQAPPWQVAFAPWGSASPSSPGDQDHAFSGQGSDAYFTYLSEQLAADGDGATSLGSWTN